MRLTVVTVGGLLKVSLGDAFAPLLAGRPDDVVAEADENEPVFLCVLNGLLVVAIPLRSTDGGREGSRSDMEGTLESLCRRRGPTVGDVRLVRLRT